MDTAGLYMDGKYKYLGEWNKDTMHGTGKFIYASGTTYDGQWDNSEYHGTGTFSWPDGRHYEVQVSERMISKHCSPWLHPSKPGEAVEQCTCHTCCSRLRVGTPDHTSVRIQ